MCSEYRCKTSHQFTDTAVRPGAVHGAESAESKQAVTHRGANDSFFFFSFTVYLKLKYFFTPFLLNSLLCRRLCQMMYFIRLRTSEVGVECRAAVNSHPHLWFIPQFKWHKCPQELEKADRTPEGRPKKKQKKPKNYQMQGVQSFRRSPKSLLSTALVKYLLESWSWSETDQSIK